MKKLCFAILALAVVSMTSCKKDPLESFPGTWTVEGENGEVTFNNDGTGYTENTNDVYLLNPCQNGSIRYFTWKVENTNNTTGDLILSFTNEDSTCTGTSSPRYKIWPGANQISLGTLIVTDIYRKK